MPNTIEMFISVNYGCVRFSDIDRFIDSSLDKLTNLINKIVFKVTKEEITRNFHLFTNKNSLSL